VSDCSLIASLIRYKQAIIDAGGADAIVNAMHAHVADTDVQRQGCWALRNVALGAGVQQQVVAAGGAVAVVRALRAHGALDTALAAEALAALANMAGGDTGCQAAVLSAGAAEAIVDCMRVHAQIREGMHAQIREDIEGGAPASMIACAAAGSTAAIQPAADAADAAAAAAAATAAAAAAAAAQVRAVQAVQAQGVSACKCSLRRPPPSPHRRCRLRAAVH